jgi:hypothetical protein
VECSPGHRRLLLGDPPSNPGHKPAAAAWTRPSPPARYAGTSQPTQWSNFSTAPCTTEHCSQPRHSPARHAAVTVRSVLTGLNTQLTARAPRRGARIHLGWGNLLSATVLAVVSAVGEIVLSIHSASWLVPSRQSGRSQRSVTREHRSAV